MDLLLLTTALALPVLLGGLWLNLLLPISLTPRRTLVWGNGTLIGLLLIPLLMRILDAQGIPLSFIATGGLAGTLIAVAVVANLFVNRPPTLAHHTVNGFSSLPISGKALFLFLLALLALRVTSLGLEILWRPLFPWDATMHWATKARVWFEHSSIVPFVDNRTWLTLGGEGVFTDRHPYYPPTIPLLQVWVNLALARWDESLMNLPWLLCLIALGASFYGQLRVSKLSPVIAIAFTYLLLSMPLINIHVALAGYADLFLGAAYCGALMAFHNWTATGERWQAVIALVFALACPLIKNEGIVWMFTLLPALVIALATRRDISRIVLLVLLCLLLLIILIQKNPLLYASAQELLTPFNADGLVGTIKTIWLHDNWHLFGYLLLALMPLSLAIPGVTMESYRGIIVALAGAIGALLFLFLFTQFGMGATDFTGVGRLCIQLFPAVLFLCALLSNELLTTDSDNSLPETALAPELSSVPRHTKANR